MDRKPKRKRGDTKGGDAQHVVALNTRSTLRVVTAGKQKMRFVSASTVDEKRNK